MLFCFSLSLSVPSCHSHQLLSFNSYLIPLTDTILFTIKTEMSSSPVAIILWYWLHFPLIPPSKPPPGIFIFLKAGQAFLAFQRFKLGASSSLFSQDYIDPSQDPAGAPAAATEYTEYNADMEANCDGSGGYQNQDYWGQV